jgi:hypothetical protein
MRVYNIEDEKPKISPEKVDRGEEIALSILKQDRKASQRKILIT